MTEIVLASGNKGKLKEIQAILSPLGFKLVSQSIYDVIEAEETGLSFIENAILKARNAAKQTGKMALADDSGLEVAALQGAPGIYSARYAGPNADDAQNNLKLLSALKSVDAEQRSANFRCCLALVRHELDPCPLIAEGIWKGSIGFEAKGDNGFGYDPLFIIENDTITSAQLKPEIKNKISHRALALKQLSKQLAIQFDSLSV